MHSSNSNNSNIPSNQLHATNNYNDEQANNGARADATRYKRTSQRHTNANESNHERANTVTNQHNADKHNERANMNPGTIEYSSKRANTSMNDNESNEEHANTSTMPTGMTNTSPCADAIKYNSERANNSTND